MTADCPITFSTKAVLLPDDPPRGFVWNYIDPNFCLFTTFDVDMDTSTIPPASFFRISVDSVWKTPDSVDWLSPRCLRATYSEAALTPTALAFNFQQPHPDMKYATGLQRGTWNQTGIEQTYNADYEMTGFVMDLDCVFTPDFDNAVNPTPANFEIRDADETKTPTSCTYEAIDKIGWGIDWTDAPVEPIDIEYDTFDIRMITATGLFTPFFNLENVDEDT